MDSLKEVFTTKKMNQVVLVILFSIYLIMGYKMPESVASMIDTTYGKVAVILMALVLFVKCHPVLGVLGFLVAYQLLTQSSVTTGSYALRKYAPTEEKKYSTLTEYNQFPYTLEQEVVKKMGPINNYESSISNSYSFNPVLDDTYNAAPIS